MTTRRRRRSTGAASLALAVLLAACGGGDGGGDDAAAPAPTTTEPATADESPTAAFEDATADRLGEEGEVSTQLALDLVASAYGPVPGAADDLPVDGMLDGSLPAWVLADRIDELTPEQLVAVRQAFGADHAARDATADDANGRVQQVALRATPDVDLDGLAAEARAWIEERLDRELGIPIRIAAVPTEVIGGLDRGDAVIAGPGLLVEADRTECRIRIDEADLTGDEASLRSTVAHEVFHCVQFFTQRSSSPPWVIEGQAEWVGESFAGGSDSSAGSWSSWLTRPDRSLLRRSYSAIGAFGALEADGVDPWSVFDEMLAAGGGRAPLHVAFGPDDPATALRLGRRATRAPDVGPSWESDGPGITADRPAAPRISLAPGAPTGAERRLPAVSSLPLDLSVSTAADAPVMLVSVDGARVALGTPNSDDVEASGALALCVGPGECTCPGGTSAIAPFDVSDGAVISVATGDGGDAALHLELVSIDEACTATPSDVPTLRMTGTVDLDLAGGWCMDDGFALRLHVGHDSGFDARRQPDPYPFAAFTYYVAASRIGSTTDAGSTTYYLDSTVTGTENISGSSFTIAPDGLSGTFSLTDGNAGSFTCPRILTYDEVYGSG